MSNRKNNNTEFEQLQKKSPLLLKRSAEIKDIPAAKVHHETILHSHEVTLPVNTMEDSEAILCCLTEFDSFAQSVQFGWSAKV